jgi:Cu-processing system permease protein
VTAVAAYAIREALRRRVFVVIAALTAIFLLLYALGVTLVFDELEGRGTVGAELLEDRALVGGTMTGIAMFAILFLGVVLAVFLTMATIGGDAERGLLQPLVARPIGRNALLAGRFLAAVAVCAAYVAAVYVVVVLLTHAAGGWWPDRPVTPALALIGAIAIMIALALLGSVHLSGSANGIAIFMLFGAGLTAGLLGQIGDALESDRLERIAGVASWALPSEGLYQAGLSELTADTGGLTGAVINLGPFGGAEAAGPPLLLWAAVYLCGVSALASWGFARRDL